jgi:hypothetical protein
MVLLVFSRTGPDNEDGQRPVGAFRAYIIRLVCHLSNQQNTESPSALNAPRRASSIRPRYGIRDRARSSHDGRHLAICSSALARQRRLSRAETGQWVPCPPSSAPVCCLRASPHVESAQSKARQGCSTCSGFILSRRIAIGLGQCWCPPTSRIPSRRRGAVRPPHPFHAFAQDCGVAGQRVDKTSPTFRLGEWLCDVNALIPFLTSLVLNAH